MLLMLATLSLSSPQPAQAFAMKVLCKCKDLPDSLYSPAPPLMAETTVRFCSDYVMTSKGAEVQTPHLRAKMAQVWRNRIWADPRDAAERDGRILQDATRQPATEE